MYTAAWKLRFHPVSSSTCLRRRGDLAEKELTDIVPTLINSSVWISTPDLILGKSSIFPMNSQRNHRRIDQTSDRTWLSSNSRLLVLKCARLETNERLVCIKII